MGDPTLQLARSVVLSAGTSLAQPAAIALTETQWHRIALWAERERVLPLLGLAAPLLGEAPDKVSDHFDRAARAERVMRRGLVHLAGQACARLDEAGIEVRVLKGLATSHSLYADPLHRPLADVDVLVSSRDFPGAIRILAPDFEERSEPPRFGSTSNWLVYSATLISRALGQQLDLHRRVQARSLRDALPEALAMGTPDVIEVSGRRFSTMSWECQILHTCLHLSSPATRLSSAADLLRQLLHPRTDLAALEAVSRDAHLVAAVQWAVARLATLVPTAPCPAFETIQRYPCPQYEAWLWHRSLGGTAGRMLVDMSALGPIGATRMAGEIVWPSREFLADRGRTRLSHLRYIADPGNQSRQP